MSSCRPISPIWYLTLSVPGPYKPELTKGQAGNSKPLESLGIIWPALCRVEGSQNAQSSQLAVMNRNEQATRCFYFILYRDANVKADVRLRQALHERRSLHSLI